MPFAGSNDWYVALGSLEWASVAWRSASCSAVKEGWNGVGESMTGTWFEEKGQTHLKLAFPPAPSPQFDVRRLEKPWEQSYR